jgi:tetratricopeptide (TPR) repeat protein
MLPGALASGCASNRAAREAEDLIAARQLTLHGLDAAGANNWSEAEELFRRAVSASPHDERAHHQYARALWHRDDRQTAILHMTQAVELSAGNPELLVELGRMYLWQGDLVLARQAGEQAIATDRQFAAAHALIGDVLLRQGRPEQALESFHLALALDTQQPLVTLAVADIYRQRAEHRRSLATLRPLNIKQLPPPVASQVCLLRGLSEKEIGRRHDALANLAQALQLGPPAADTLFVVAQARLEMGDAQSARETLRAALSQDANHAASRELLARLDGQPHLADRTLLNTPAPQNR